MAGDWLKIEANTPEKEEVLAITATMGWDDADITVGKLFRLWRWFDQQTVDGNASRVTSSLLDRVVGVTGFCDAVRSVGWLVISESGISLPKFDRHNGNTAKNRALTAKRVAKCKSVGNAESNGASVTEALPREEKRREDISPTVVGDKAPAKNPPRFNASRFLFDLCGDEQLIADWLTLRKSKKAAVTETAIKGIQREAAKAKITLADAMRVCCEKGWAGFDSTWDWQSTFKKQQVSGRNGYHDSIVAAGKAIFGDLSNDQRESNIIDITPEKSAGQMGFENLPRIAG